MRVDISEEPMTALAEYANIHIAFEVNRVLDIAVPDNRIPDIVLTERKLDVPYMKDYDAIEGEGPANSPNRFDTSNWGLFIARIDGRMVGGAAVAFKTPGLIMLEDREDLALLWDIRIVPEARGQGIGTAFFKSAEAWAAMKGCTRLKVETQNINVPACRFYARQGCVIEAIDGFAYPKFPDEIQMLWCKDLSR